MPKDIVAQARQSLENVKAIIEQAGLTVADIVKTMVFVKDLNDFAAVNGEYERFFKEKSSPRVSLHVLLCGSGPPAERCWLRN